MIIEWKKNQKNNKKKKNTTQNLRVEQNKGSSREKLNNNNNKKEFQEDKTMAHISAGRKRLLFFLHRVTWVTGGAALLHRGERWDASRPLSAPSWWVLDIAELNWNARKTQTTADKALYTLTLFRHLSPLTVLVVVFLSNHVQKGNSTTSPPPPPTPHAL